MTGVVAIYSRGGCPYAGGDCRSFDRADVRAIGKLVRYCDAVTRYLVRLADGTELFAKGTEQGADDQKWLRRLGRRLVVTMSATTAREVGFAIAWMEVEAATEEIEIREAQVGEVPAFPAQGVTEMAVPPSDDRAIVLSAEDFDALTERISNPRPPSEQLRALFGQGKSLVTAETITDEQIRKLLADEASTLALRYDCVRALDAGLLEVLRHAARKRCAEAWNARRREGQLS